MEFPTVSYTALAILVVAFMSFIRRWRPRKLVAAGIPLDKQSVVLTGKATPDAPDPDDNPARAAAPTTIDVDQVETETPHQDRDPVTDGAAAAPGHASRQSQSDSSRRRRVGGRQFLEYLHEDARTVFSWFERAVRTNGDKRMLGQQKCPNGEECYDWLTYREVGDRVKTISAGLAELGCKEKQRIAILGSTRPITTISEYAAFRLNMITVPIMYKASHRVLEHILDEVQPMLILSSGDKIAALLQICKDKSIGTTTIVSFDSLPQETLEEARELQIDIRLLHEVEEAGKKNPCAVSPATPDDIASISYTSGKGSMPKGVLLSHRNLIATASADIVGKPLSSYAIQPPVLMFFGGVAHIMPRVVVLYAMELGGSIGYYAGKSTMKDLLLSMQQLRPTTIVTVPSVLHGMVDSIHGTIGRRWQPIAMLLNWAVRWQLGYVKQGYSSKGTLVDWLLLRPIRERMGGRIEVIVVGSAALSAKTAQLLRVFMACDVIEAYGKTETASAGTLSLAADTSHGHVGRPMLCTHIKLTSVPDMGYDAFYGKGEVCIKGPSVCMGLWQKDGPHYDGVRDENGWHHSGDIGRWRPNGTLEIVDRIGNVFRLTNGVSIAPEKIEAILQEVPYITDIFIYGSSSRAMCVAIVVPSEKGLKTWLTTGMGYKHSEAFSNMDLVDLCQNTVVHQVIMRSIKEHCSAHGLSSQEMPHAIFLSPTPFRDTPGLVTPTLKVRRKDVTEKFAPVIQEMYAKLKKKS
ncbi:long-chain-fatty-acid--CoA ligase 5-like [Sycon ciliatum]|uniref:long-chain-fatty-acid--CoA ligase 5-like n=1 Tax=Sycon ciliatum TaxID=27933 RepID=UPI0031F656FC